MQIIPHDNDDIELVSRDWYEMNSYLKIELELTNSPPAYKVKKSWAHLATFCDKEVWVECVEFHILLEKIPKNGGSLPEYTE